MQDNPPSSNDALIALARAMLDLDIPAECLPGVRANLELLADHARRIAPPSAEPA